MPVIQLCPNGLTAGMPGDNRGKVGIRGEVRGWTVAATRRNLRFLYSVNVPDLTGLGFAVTLTLRDCPESADVWHRLRRAFLKRMERAGLLRAHWVTEWQRRGVPHLHGAFFFPEPETARDFIELRARIVSAWCEVAQAYGAAPWAQHVAPLRDTVGWLKYVAKHAARGVQHYQRSMEAVPEGWHKTGRVWGYVGEWPTRDAMRIELSHDGYYRFRRLVRSWRISRVRVAQDWQRLPGARRMLKYPDRSESARAGVSEWVPQDVSLQMLAHLAAEGYSVAS